MNNITNQFALETLTEVRERVESEPVHSTFSFSRYTVHKCSARCTKQKIVLMGMGMVWTHNLSCHVLMYYIYDACKM